MFFPKKTMTTMKSLILQHPKVSTLSTIAFLMLLIVFSINVFGDVPLKDILHSLMK